MPSRMSSTLFVPYQPDQRFQYLVHPADMYHQLYSSSAPISQPSSFVRSSAQDIPTPPQQPFYTAGYTQPSAVDPYQEEGPYQEELSSSVSSTSSIGLAASLGEHAQDFAEPHYAFTATAAAQPYQFETIPRSIPWAKEEQLTYSQLSDAAYDASGRYLESQLYQPSYFEKTQGQYTPPQLPSYYHTPEPVLSQEPTLGAYTTQDTLPSVVFSGSPRVDVHGIMDQPGSPASSYAMGSSPHVQYASTPERGINPQFVSLQEVSPSPTVSPDQVYSNLPSPSASKQQLHGTYIVADPILSSADDDSSASDVSSTPVAPRRTIKTRTAAPPRKRVKTDFEDETESRVSLSDSGESEREDEGDDDADDDDYQPEHSENTRSSRRKTSSASRSIGARSESPFVQRPRVPPPVPVPNLTKKSRGRRVPTATAQEDAEEKAKRGYRCKVAGCNKLFQRGEHLKRHVRSIHTNEKPHKCPYKHCGKDFSRHDNLRQHMRVHRNDPLDSEGTTGSA